MTVFEYDLRSPSVGSAESRTKTILKQNEIPGGYDPNQYHSERIFARSHDGVEVPISLAVAEHLLCLRQANAKCNSLSCGESFIVKT